MGFNIKIFNFLEKYFSQKFTFSVIIFPTHPVTIIIVRSVLGSFNVIHQLNFFCMRILKEDCNVIFHSLVVLF